MNERCPAPQVGRRWSSSGRDRVSTKMARVRDHSTIDSMKSINPGSAHCRSSNTSTVGPRSAIRSKKVRQAEKSSSRSPQALLQRRVQILGDPRPHAHHLPERPEGDPLTVGGGAALLPVNGLGEAVDVFEELPGEPALADPSEPCHRDESDSLLPAVAWRSSLRSRNSSSRPTKGGSARSDRPTPRRCATTRSACQTGRGRRRRLPGRRHASSSRRRGPCRVPRRTAGGTRCSPDPQQPFPGQWPRGSPPPRR